MDNNFEPLENSDIQHLHLFLYLIPVLGFFPSLWTLYRARGILEQRGRGDKEDLGDKEEVYLPPLHPHTPSPLAREIAISRLSVTLAFSWLLGYLLLNIGAETSEFLTLRLLVLNSLLTSGYFLVSIWLMVRLASRRSVRLPGFTGLAQVIGKHLS